MGCQAHSEAEELRSAPAGAGGSAGGSQPPRVRLRLAPLSAAGPPAPLTGEETNGPREAEPRAWRCRRRPGPPRSPREAVAACPLRPARGVVRNRARHWKKKNQVPEENSNAHTKSV